jgi:hypothetical protein
MQIHLISLILWVLPSLVLLALSLTTVDKQGPPLEAYDRLLGRSTL